MPDAIPVPPEAAKHVDQADFSQPPGPELAALDAAMQATEGMRQWSLFPRPSVRAQILHAALKAARPLIAAAERRRIGEASFSPDEDDRTGLFRLARADGVLVERERIRQLAARVDAVYPDPGAPGLTLSFARLIGDQDA